MNFFDSFLFPVNTAGAFPRRAPTLVLLLSGVVGQLVAGAVVVLGPASCDIGMGRGNVGMASCGDSFMLMGARR